MSEKTLLELAKEHQVQCYFGKHNISKNRHILLKDTACIVCGRKMTVKKFENAPHYCYKCDQDIEGVFQDY